MRGPTPARHRGGRVKRTQRPSIFHPLDQGRTPLKAQAAGTHTGMLLCRLRHPRHPNGPQRQQGWCASPLGWFVGVWGDHGATWAAPGLGMGRALLLGCWPAAASLVLLWWPWAVFRPMQWPPDPQGAHQRPSVGCGWCRATYNACWCRNARLLAPPSAPVPPFGPTAGPPGRKFMALTGTKHGTAAPPTQRRLVPGSLWVGCPLQWAGGAPMAPQRPENGPKQAAVLLSEVPFLGLLENTNGRAWTPCFVSCLGL